MIGRSSETSKKNDKGIGRYDLSGKIDAPDYLSVSTACQRDDEGDDRIILEKRKQPRSRQITRVGGAHTLQR